MFCSASLAWLAIPSQAAEWTLQSSTIENSGGWISNTAVSSASVSGQDQPVGIATNGSFTSYGGFIYTFVLQPTNDHDSDLIADEVDVDDDNDGLNDTDELSGSRFDPQTSTDPFSDDSDDDGVSDRDEARAGTNPKDAGSQFAVTDMSIETNMIRVSWKSREGRAYDVMTRSNLVRETPPRVLDTVTAVNGSGPWEETETETVLPLPEANADILYIGKPGE
jgi:hypothetical protein